MFTIQLGHPKIKFIPAREFEEVRDLFMPLFRTREESIYLFWNDIPLRFGYREDLYNSFNDILAMVWLVQKEKKGKTKATIQNQLLKANLVLQWEDDELRIEGTFEAFEDLYSAFAEQMNERNTIHTSKEQFLAEWNTLLHQLVVAIDASKCAIVDGVERRRLELMQSVARSIDNYGRLYTK